MSAEPEPLAAILAEMRADEIETEDGVVRLDAYADRIEAAAKREYEEAKAYFKKLHDGPSMICTAKNCAMRNVGLAIANAAPGNAAAMRAALEKAWELLDGDDRQLIAYSDTGALMDIIKPALAAPARNCDRFADCNSAWRAYNAIENRERLPGFDFWLYAPAKGGAE